MQNDKRIEHVASELEADCMEQRFTSFSSGRSWKEDVVEEKKDFSSYISHYIHLCWTNWPCWEDNVTAGVSAETAKINLKLKKKTDYCIDSH